MQSEPLEAPKTAISENQPLDSSSTTQHGSQLIPDPASDRFLSQGDGGEPSPLLDDADAASVTSSDTRRGRNINTGRISSRTNSSQEGSPGSRIEAYEKASAKKTKPSGILGFQVVPSTKGKTNQGVSIDSFPNEVLTHVLSHLPPDTLSAMSLVSRRFHRLVTTPHAWRIAFARYFPATDAADEAGVFASSLDAQEHHLLDRRTFSRLSALASWRSEYILRTSLLRSLGRGRPALQVATRSGSSRHGGTSATAVITLGSGLLYPVSHIHATFGIGLNKKQPMFIHGAVEQGIASTSDPSSGKIGNWGVTDFEAFKHFADMFVGEVEYGLGPGNVVGMPNVMDISQPYGKLYGEACPGGRLFYTSVAEQRGRFLSITSSPVHRLGVPEVTMIGCSVCSVWIAKTESVLKATNGLIGLLAGFSNGVLAAYALGVNPVQDRRFEKGEPTARWVLSPGVPIVAIQIDEKFSSRRHSLRRIWAVVLNALGEVFYLTDVPVRPEFKGRPNASEIEQFAWQTGRSVDWCLIESTRRVAKPDPFKASLVEGSYSPRSSSNATGLSQDQLIAETKEIEMFLPHKPKEVQNRCEGWDMRRKIVVDFAGDDHHRAGESIFLISCGVDEYTPASIRRLTRHKTKNASDFDLEAYPEIGATQKRPLLFGHGFENMDYSLTSASSPRSAPRSRTSSHEGIVDTSYDVDWRISNFKFGLLRNVQITATAIDESDYATLAAFEDPLLGMSGGSNSSSPVSSPLGTMQYAASSSEIPGHRARFLAVGTASGNVVLWDMRSSMSPAADIINSIQPSRTMYTKSPQISSLALTSLYLVHGGNDGLVQAWDPLASTTEPIRTLNSRFSDRARRRIAQAEATPQGVGNNYYAAGAIVLDPDPTILRGMVSLGTHLRYWSYSSSAADAYKSRKRGQHRRRSERGSNAAANEQRYSHTGRGVLKDYITNEKHELEREKIAKRKEDERLSGRFGIDLLGAEASEEELLAYATMLSAESWQSDEIKRRGSSGAAVSTASSETIHDVGESSGFSDIQDEAVDKDIEEAIRLSLLDAEFPSPSSSPATGSASFVELDIPIRLAKAKGSRHGTPSKTEAIGSSSTGPSTAAEESELEFALQLSLAEERSRLEELGNADVNNDFPALARPGSERSDSSSSKGKGKGKKRSGRQEKGA